MSMIRRILALDGVNVICHFRDDGYLLEGYGLMGRDDMVRLAQFAHDYRRMIQGNADQLAMFTGMRGWTPPHGWVVRARYSQSAASATWCASWKAPMRP